MTIRITRRFVIEISSTSLYIGIPYIAQIFLGQKPTDLERWKALRRA